MKSHFDQELVQDFECRRRLRTRIVKVSVLSTQKLLFDLAGHPKKPPTHNIQDFTLQ